MQSTKYLEEIELCFSKLLRDTKQQDRTAGLQSQHYCIQLRKRLSLFFIDVMVLSESEQEKQGKF